VAIVAVGSLACHSFPSLIVAAAAIGASVGLLTVAVAASLPEIVPPGSAGMAVGIATGAAYFLSNVPVLFEASTAVRALVPAGLAGVAAAFLRSPQCRDAPWGVSLEAFLPGGHRPYFFSLNVITAWVLPLVEETITLASRLPSALLPVTVPPVVPLVV
jgi:MFS family permease